MTTVSLASSRSVRLQQGTGRGPSVLVIAGTFALALAFGVGFAWSRTELVHAAMRTGELRREERSLEMREKELLTEISALKNPARIERDSRKRLGLMPRSPAQVLQVKPEIMRRVFGEPVKEDS